ncbi:MAG: hypothetical protein JW759_00810 [Candidatus Coatesbacteria bacterium]|nr:hypothetical protein [Candidatus Coatesbacteria bacterium]
MSQEDTKAVKGFRIAFWFSLAVMWAVAFLLLDIQLTYGSWLAGSIFSDFSRAYRPLLLTLLFAIVAAAFTSVRLDRACGRDRPVFRAVVDWMRKHWARAALESPLWLKIAIPVLSVVLLLIFLPSLRRDAVEYRALTIPSWRTEAPQLIAESRGEATQGYSRVRLGDDVGYLREVGYHLLLVDCVTEKVLRQAHFAPNNLEESMSLLETLGNLPNNTLAVLIGHGRASDCITPQLATALAQLGSDATRESLGPLGHLLLLRHSNGKTELQAELAGNHAVLALSPNLPIRAYFLLRRLAPLIYAITIVASILLGVAAFARVNHSLSWPSAFSCASFASAALAVVIIIGDRTNGLAAIAGGIVVVLTSYLLFRAAFAAHRKVLWHIVTIVVFIFLLFDPEFFYRNSKLMEAATTVLVLYLGYKLYSVLFGLKDAVSYPLTVLFVSRALLFIICYLSMLFFTEAPRSFWDVFNYWDAGWYLKIAREGYHLSQQGYSSPNFFPMYPFLIAALQTIVEQEAIAGTVVANLAFAAALCVLYSLTGRRWGEGVARRSMLLIAIGPWSFFFSAIYSEALFLLCCLAFFVFALDGKWPQAALCGFFAALTRSVGATLLLVGAWQYMKGIRFNPWRLRPNALWLALIPLGSGLFSFTLYSQTGDLFANVTASEAWTRKLTINPLSVLAKSFSGLNLNLSLLSTQKMQTNLTWGVWILAVVLVLLAAVPVARRLGSSFAVFTVCGMVLPLLTGVLDSVGRYAQVLFPVTILLALYAESERVYSCLALTFSAFWLFFAILFANKFWVV